MVIVLYHSKMKLKLKNGKYVSLPKTVVELILGWLAVTATDVTQTLASISLDLASEASDSTVSALLPV